MSLVSPENVLRTMEAEAPFQRVKDGGKGRSDEEFARVDEIVGGLVPLVGILMMIEGVVLKMVEVLRSDFEYEQRTILHRGNIPRTKTEAIVRQRYTLMRWNGKGKRGVGQALVTSKLTDRNSNQVDARDDRVVSSGSVADKNDQNISTKNVGKKYHDMPNKYHRCLLTGHR